MTASRKDSATSPLLAAKNADAFVANSAPLDCISSDVRPVRASIHPSAGPTPGDREEVAERPQLAGAQLLSDRRHRRGGLIHDRLAEEHGRKEDDEPRRDREDGREERLAPGKARSQANPERPERDRENDAPGDRRQERAQDDEAQDPRPDDEEEKEGERVCEARGARTVIG